MKVSVLHKELEYEVEKVRYKKIKVMQLRIRTKPELPVGKETILNQSAWSLRVVIDKYTINHLLLEEGRRGVNREGFFLPLKRGNLLDGGGLFEKGS